MEIGIEDLITLAKGEDGPEKLTEALEAFVSSRVEKETLGLKKKRDDLLAKLAKKGPASQVAPGDTEDVAGLRAALQAAQEELEIAKAQDPSATRELAEKIATARVEKLRAKHESELSTLQREREAVQSELAKMRSDGLKKDFRADVLAAARRLGVDPTLEDDLVRRLQPFWRIGDDGLEPFDPKTGLTIDGKAGPITPEEMVNALYESNGTEDWNGRGRRFFVAEPGGSGAEPAGKPDSVFAKAGSMSQAAYEAHRRRQTGK